MAKAMYIHINKLCNMCVKICLKAKIVQMYKFRY